MEAIQQARKLYSKANYHQESLTDDDRKRLEQDIQRFITIGIKEVPAKNLFHFGCVLVILKAALNLKASDNSDVLPVARAFESLEQYLLLLVEHPWKPEFKEIKMYGGYFRTRIKAVLPDCESIFRIAGYVIDPDKFVLLHKGPMNEENLLLLAFDCKVALVECKTIAEYYHKIKGLAMTLKDAMDMTLHDERSRDKGILGLNPNLGNGLIPSKSDCLRPQAPPAIPKRQPILNGSTMKQNLVQTSGALYAGFPQSVYENSNLDMLGTKFKDYPSKTQQHALKNVYASNVKSPLASSGVIPEAFAYIDDEILPEFPQGTTEDHMRESLKLVNQQEGPRQPALFTPTAAALRDGAQTSDDWKWLPKYNGSGLPASQADLAGLAMPRSHHVRPATNFSGMSSIDEGIDMDMSHLQLQQPLRPMLSQPPLPNKSVLSMATPPSDQGYRTNTLSEHPYSRGHSQMLLPSQTIYHPPSVNLDGPGSDLFQMRMLPRSNMPPPPIPSRALKPQLRRTDGDETDGPAMPSSQQPVGNQSAKVWNQNVNSGGYDKVGQPTLKPDLPSSIPFSDAGPTLRRDRLAVGKSKSLKYEGTAESLRQQAIAARAARSMDMTLTTWECKACTTVNMASDLTCSVCTHSRHGPDISSPPYGETRKSCPGCTYENDSSIENCEICGSKLENSYSYV